MTFPTPSENPYIWKTSHTDSSLAADYSAIVVAPIASSAFRLAISRASYSCLLATRETLRSGFGEDPTRLQRVELAISARGKFVEDSLKNLCGKKDGADCGGDESELNND